MKFLTRLSVRRTVCATVALSMLLQPLVAGAALLNLVKTPLFVTTPITPLVMLDISKDQQLYKKAYNDYSDLDSDGSIETTYKHSIDYYGYFDSYKCYDYGSTGLLGGGHFYPSAFTVDKYCTGLWSGNFLNWVSMTRMDAVRKLLFGGARSIDQATNGTGATTVLDRAFVPSDAHAWAKYYNGSDIAKLTPFNPSTTPQMSGDFDTGYSLDPGTIAPGTWVYFFTSLPLGFADNVAYGDQIKAVATADGTKTVTGRVVDKGSYNSGANRYVGIQVDAKSTTGTGAPGTNFWNLSNLSTPGLTFCNVTLGGSSGSNRYSHTDTRLPRIRVTSGNYELWSASERFQCQWYGNDDRDNSYSKNRQGPFGNTNSSNGNQAALSGLNASAENPSPGGYSVNGSPVPGRGLGNWDYFVRVEACQKAFLPVPTGQKSTEKCKQYNQAGFYKPIGLLQVYGDDERINFGLLTGSYAKNISGGVLRKNIVPFLDEVNLNGTFVASPPSGSIVSTLSKLRIYGYDYNQGFYNNAPDNCPFQFTSADLTNGKCRTWGNPMSEIYAESLRYFSGATTPTAAFNADDSGLIAGLTTATWPNPNNLLTNANYCAPLNVLVFNASVSSKDSDEVSNPFGGGPISGTTPIGYTNLVGTAEGVSSGSSYFVGSNGVTSNNLCDAKPFNTSATLGLAQGICPEAPSLNGSYLMGGLAYAAHTNRIRNDLTAVPTSDTTSLKVNTYGIALASNVPIIEIAVPGGAPGQKVVIQPVYRLNVGGKIGSGAIVDVKVVSQTATSGRLYVNWEDSEQGGDYDQDVWGVIDYTISSSAITVTTDTIAASTANPQGFGYVISGTTKDGPHFTSGFGGFNFVDPTGVTGCTNCNISDAPVSITYALSASGSGKALKDPLYYAAKYGGFTDSGNNGTSPVPDLAAEWDIYINATGALGSDGIPDNFFSVANPLGLEKALDKLFLAILQSSAASAVAANSSKLNTSTRVYQAVFNQTDWSGKLLAFAVDPVTGKPDTVPAWDAGQITLNATSIAPSTRNILTFNKGVSGVAPKGIAFTWPATPGSPTTSELSLPQITALNTIPYTTSTDSGGQARLDYIRGDASNEGEAPTNFRRRATTKLGDIINSNPNFVGPPSAGYPDSSYVAFATNPTYKNRTPMIYVGANDGMLHAFDASLTGSPGAEKLAFIPSPVFRNLSKLTSPAFNKSHEYFVDGSPVVGDALVKGSWKSVLVGGLNRGGQGVYALDVSDPGSFAVSNAANQVLWEFTDADDPDLGFTFGTPAIRRMANGKFAAIVSGGYNNTQDNITDPNEVLCASGDGTTTLPYLPSGCTVSKTGQGYIFILNLDGPTGSNGAWVLGIDYFKISTDTKTAPLYGNPTTPNGLATPFPADINGDGIVDFIYAGDLNGDLWKFDVRSTSGATWMNMTSNRVKLFTAVDDSSNRQPITSGVEAVLHPTGNGVLVTFGTGKYLEKTDVVGTFLTQSLYGIWDLNDQPTISTQTVVTGRSQLMVQGLQGGLTGSVVNFDPIDGTRITTKHLPNYGDTTRDDAASNDFVTDQKALLTARGHLATNVLPKQYGWYYDLLNGAPPTGAPAGERVIFQPIVKNGIVLYSSLYPFASSCLGSTGGFNITLSVTTGAIPDATVFDLNGDGLVNTSDMKTITLTDGSTFKIAVSSKAIQGGSAQPPTLVSKGAGLDVGYQNPTGGKLQSETYKFGRGPGRLSWREILY